MPQVCSEVTTTKLVPGTGVIGPIPDNSWDASARSVETVDPGKPWEFAFDPVPSSVFITGLFAADAPRPSNYVVSIRYEIDRFFVQLYNEVRGPFVHASGRIQLIFNPQSGYRVVANGTEVWRS